MNKYKVYKTPVTNPVYPVYCRVCNKTSQPEYYRVCLLQGSGFMVTYTCSELCANMYIMQHMDELIILYSSKALLEEIAQAGS